MQPAYFFRRLVRLTLSGLADRVRAMPRLRALAINILRHFPWLDRVLRAALRPTPPALPVPADRCGPMRLDRGWLGLVMRIPTCR